MEAMPRMVFFHLGWMEHYRADDDSDQATGPHGHLKNNGRAHECFNFRPRNGTCYGYVPSGINISRNLGAPREAAYVDDMVCVWLAKHPEQNKRLVVGWYRDARVYRTSNHEAEPSGNQLDGSDVQYLAVAPKDNCTLVPASRRTFKVPTKGTVAGGLGQSTVWYGRISGFHERVWDYINRWDEQVKRKRVIKHGRKYGGRHNPDPNQRKQIEKVAVNKAIEFFSSADGGGYKVVSRELEALGWDLEASRPGCATLLIEVKGRSGGELVVELTPNEFGQMMSKEHCGNYVLFVVTNCGGEHPVAHEFRFRGGGWSDVDGTKLKIERRTGAVCRT